VEKRKSYWTPERDELLRQLWPTLSAGQIAAEMGTTRSAVLGRYHRLWGNGEQYKQTQKAKQKAEKQGVSASRRRAQNVAMVELGRNLAQGMDRGVAVIAARGAGATLRSIADALGVSKSRVYQIIAGG
jgi:hypothetical protein